MQISKVLWVKQGHKIKKIFLPPLLHVQFRLHFCQLDFLNTHKVWNMWSFFLNWLLQPFPTAHIPSSLMQIITTLHHMCHQLYLFLWVIYFVLYFLLVFKTTNLRERYNEHNSQKNASILLKTHKQPLIYNKGIVEGNASLFILSRQDYHRNI